jgi:DNA segregation ATPase FtsK/SpoIIIE, S-DNA-T family
MRRVVTGEELAQLYNPDPFAMPRWRAPVHRTPFGIILAAKLVKLLAWIARMAARHPLAAGMLALVALVAVTWVELGWVTLVGLVLAAVVILIAWRWFWPVSFSRWVGRPARGTWRAWCYRRRWAAVMAIAGVAPWYQGRTLLPVLGKVTATRYVDRVYVRLVSGQCAADFAKCAENLAHGFRALLCRVRTAKSGAVVLEVIRRDALAALVPALPIPDHPDHDGAAGRQAGRRPALADQTPWDARADRGRHRSREGLAAVGPAPGHVPAPAAGPGPGAGR